MPHRMEKHLALFQVLEMSDRKQRKAIINALNKSQINILCEVVYNFLHGALPINKKALEGLRRYKEHFRQIVNKNTSLKKKKISLVKVSEQLRTLLKLVAKRFSNINQ